MTKVTFVGASNGSAFLLLFVILGWLGLMTSWFQKIAGETDILLKPGIWELNLEFVMAKLMSLGVVLSFPCGVPF